ncbi:MAG: DUF488 domain-containing protein, partial [Planctomycetota bacterium]
HPAPALFTVGHSNRSIAEFIALIEAHGIETIVDVRSYPSSKRYPHFDRALIERELHEAGVRYVWLGRELGGLRKLGVPDSPHVAIEEQGFRNYADHMATHLFAVGIERLLDEAAQAPTACMCAEKDWHHCHRSYLADALVALHDADVRHIRDKDTAIPHELHKAARVVDRTLIYDAGGQRQTTFL